MNKAHAAPVITQVGDIKAPPQKWNRGPAVIDTWYGTLNNVLSHLNELRVCRNVYLNNFNFIYSNYEILLLEWHSWPQ